MNERERLLMRAERGIAEALMRYGAVQDPATRATLVALIDAVAGLIDAYEHVDPPHQERIRSAGQTGADTDRLSEQGNG